MQLRRLLVVSSRIITPAACWLPGNHQHMRTWQHARTLQVARSERTLIILANRPMFSCIAAGGSTSTLFMMFDKKGGPVSNLTKTAPNQISLFTAAAISSGGPFAICRYNYTVRASGSLDTALPSLAGCLWGIIVVMYVLRGYHVQSSTTHQRQRCEGCCLLYSAHTNLAPTHTAAAS
jgi:hypothetical protein